MEAPIQQEYCHLVVSVHIYLTPQIPDLTQTNWIHNIWLTLRSVHIISEAVDDPLQ